MYVCIYIYIYIYVSVYIYIYTYVYTSIPIMGFHCVIFSGGWPLEMVCSEWALFASATACADISSCMIIIFAQGLAFRNGVFYRALLASTTACAESSRGWAPVGPNPCGPNWATARSPSH